MSSKNIGFMGVALTASFLTSCGVVPADGDRSVDLDADMGVAMASSALTAQQRLATCAQDPRVVTGLASKEICAGADIFFRETFGGNGRTCGTCHPARHNFTIDAPFINALPPSDPLFVFEQDPANLGGLETASLKAQGVVLENVDGFDDLNTFVTRSVPHTLSMKTSIASDLGDPLATTPPAEKTGWAGDGAPGDGSLRSFLDGAIKQHYPKTLARRPGIDFRVATPTELDLTNTFQQALGRTNELDLTQVNLADAEANVGRQAFLDPQRGRCNVCHLNAGANFQDTGKNRNFNTGMVRIPAGQIGTVNGGQPFFDGGFGLMPFDALQLGFNNSLGNGAFNTPPLIEAADTPPFFHNNDVQSQDIETAVFFYVDPFPFPTSPAATDLVARFGTPIQFSDADGFAIARFLRALNVAFNLDLAKQRLRAAQTLFNRFGDTRIDIQIGLFDLAGAEIDDALTVLSRAPTQPFYPVSVDRLNLAKAELAAARTAPASSRGGHISNAISRVENARDQIGANINFNLGAGNLFF
jgi:cytochrome c peroxidase